MKYNIAFGENIVKALYEDDIEDVIRCINDNDGDIIGYDTEIDHPREFLEYSVGSKGYAFVTDEELEIINRLL